MPYYTDTSPQSVVWRHSFQNNKLLTKHNDYSPTTQTMPQGIQKSRRKSSFNTYSSPHARRRSFLSRTMLENDTFQYYELSSYSSYSSESSYSYGNSNADRIPSFSINLSESQGFIWNQDLFATSYQQARAGVNSSLSMSEGTQNPVEVVDIIVGDNDGDETEDEIVYELVKVEDDFDRDYDDEADDDDDDDDDVVDDDDDDDDGGDDDILMDDNNTNNEPVTTINEITNQNVRNGQEDDEDDIFVSEL